MKHLNLDQLSWSATLSVLGYRVTGTVFFTNDYEYELPYHPISIVTSHLLRRCLDAQNLEFPKISKSHVQLKRFLDVCNQKKKKNRFEDKKFKKWKNKETSFST